VISFDSPESRDLYGPPDSVVYFQVGPGVFVQGFAHFPLPLLGLCKDDEGDSTVADRQLPQALLSRSAAHIQADLEALS
jgi:hypothetical protein